MNKSMANILFESLSQTERKEPIKIVFDENASDYTELYGRAALEILKSMKNHRLLKFATIEYDSEEESEKIV